MGKANEIDAGGSSIALRTNAEGITAFEDRMQGVDPSQQQQNSVIPKEDSAESPGINPSISSKHGKFRTVTIVIALYLTLFIAALDQTIVSTAVPTISSELNSAKGYTWIGGAYLISSAAGGPIWAKLSDIWGRKPLLLLAAAWFFCSSIVCARSGSMGMLVAGRALQGVAGGGCIQLVTIAISDMFSLKRRSLFLGCLEVMWAIAGGAGPVLGGVFSQYVNWRWIFWINLPISGSSFVVLFFFLDLHNPRTSMKDGMMAIDWLGSLSILGVTLMLLLGLDFGGETFPWNSPKVICLLVFGSIAILIFIFSERKFARYPLMPLALFRNRSNIATLIVTLCHGIVFIGGDYYMPLYLQSTHSATPLKSGLMVLPYMVTAAIMGIICGIITHRYSAYRALICAGTCFLTLGMGLYIALGAETSPGTIVGFEIITGIGAGLLFQPVIIAIQAFTAQDDIATAVATLEFIRCMGTSLGVVLGGVVFQNSMTERSAYLAAAGIPKDILSKLSGADAAANVGLVATIEDPKIRLIVREAFAWSTRNMWIFYTCVGAVAVVASAFVKKSTLSAEHVETRTGLLREKVEVGEELREFRGAVV